MKQEEFENCFRFLSDFSEEETDWLIPGWLPEGQITLLAADGGTGKTSLWVNILAALSRGDRCFLDPPEYRREPLGVAFFTTEDSVRKKLKKNLRVAGADMARIFTMDMRGDKSGSLRAFKFGTPEMAEVIRRLKPALCVFDPIQGFIPPSVNMSSRNEMRDCLQPLIGLGEETGTSFLLVCHTNKRQGAWGRDRISDSADLWDAARSVWMAGYTEEEGIRYLSQEKNSYDTLRDTVLFSIGEDGQVEEEGTTLKHDRDFMQSKEVRRSAGKRKACKAWILERLGQAEQESLKSLCRAAIAAGYTKITYERAKSELVSRDKLARTWSTGFGENKDWYIALTPREEEKMIE